MGWLRNLFIFPDDVWAAAAGKLGAEFVQGKWLANSEIKLLHRGFPITLFAGSDPGSDNSSEYTRAVPGVSLDPKIGVLLDVLDEKGFLAAARS